MSKGCCCARLGNLKGVPPAEESGHCRFESRPFDSAIANVMLCHVNRGHPDSASDTNRASATSTFTIGYVAVDSSEWSHVTLTNVMCSFVQILMLFFETMIDLARNAGRRNANHEREWLFRRAAVPGVPGSKACTLRNAGKGMIRSPVARKGKSYLLRPNLGRSSYMQL